MNVLLSLKTKIGMREEVDFPVVIWFSDLADGDSRFALAE